MGKKKNKSEYNDFLDGEKLRDNAEIRTSLQVPSVQATNSPQSTSQHGQRPSRREGQGGKGPPKPPLTHFLCLPLITEASKPQLQKTLEKLRQELEKDNTVPAKAVRPLGTLHLTLGVMSVDEARIDDLKQYLQDLGLPALFRSVSEQQVAEKAAEDGIVAENFAAASMPQPAALTVNLESLVPMQSPSRTSILYAEPRDASQRLYAFGSELRKRFTEANYMVEDTRPLKLHATIINTIYAKSRENRKSVKSSEPGAGRKDGALESVTDDVIENDHVSKTDGQDGDSRAEGRGPKAKSWMRFDARSLITTFENFVWAEGIQIDRVHICKMGAKKIWSGESEGEGEVIDEQYEVIASTNILN